MANFGFPKPSASLLKSATQKAKLDHESKLLLTTLERHNWNRRAAAKELGISYRTILYKIKFHFYD